jgi:hypothetical protein
MHQQNAHLHILGLKAWGILLLRRLLLHVHGVALLHLRKQQHRRMHSRHDTHHSSNKPSDDSLKAENTQTHTLSKVNAHATCNMSSSMMQHDSRHNACMLLE